MAASCLKSPRGTSCPFNIVATDGRSKDAAPAQALIDYVEGGHTVDEFLDDFPSVSRVQDRGWAGLKNEVLLSRASDAGIGAFVTVDRNIEFQLVLRSLQLGVVARGAVGMLH